MLPAFPMSARPSRFAPYRVSAAAIILVGLTAAVAVYHDARRHEDDATAVEFERKAAVRHALTSEVVQRYPEALHGLATLFTFDHGVSPPEFARLIGQLRPRVSGAMAFQWAPYVSHLNRASLELTFQREYAPRRFEITEFTPDGRGRRAQERDWYVPICLLEPMAGNEIVLGYDLTTAPTAGALRQAEQTRRITVSPQFTLRQQRADESGVVVILAVFPWSDAGAPPVGTRPLGFLQCALNVRQFLEYASSHQPDIASDMLFVDGSESDPQKRTLLFNPAEGPVNARVSEQDFRSGAAFLHQAALPFGGRDWYVLYRPRMEWVEHRRSSTPWWRGVTVAALAGLLAGLVTVTGRRTRTIERVVAERTAELIESRRQYANLVHALPGMAYRARYGPQLETLFASDGAAALTGWSAEDFVAGRVHLRDLIHPEDLDRVRRETRDAIAHRKDLEMTYRIRVRDGAEKWVLARGRGVYDEQGTPSLIEGLVIDISEQKRSEETRLGIERKLLESQKLESLGLLAGGIAHDFNNLLSAILGNASLARMSIESTNPADSQLRAIETASLRAAELCRQMLAYAGKGRFVVERVNVSSLTEDLLPLLRVSTGRGAELKLNLARDLPGVKADATQLRQIVMNLVLNAVDAVTGRRDGVIEITTGVAYVTRAMLAECVTGQSLPEGQYLFIEIRDNGCGMEPDVRAKIFDPFFTTKFAGRGLGLAAVLGIIRGHNGALRVESEVDRGSEFRLYLPIIPGEHVPVEEPAPAEPASEWTHGGNALVVEDEDPVRQMMVQLLDSFGFQVHAAPEGRSGVEAFRENAQKWDLVVIDLIMPGMTGEETLAALQAIRPDVRVLLVSGYTEGEIMKRVRGTGQIGFLPKPFRRDTFEAKLRELFSATE